LTPPVWDELISQSHEHIRAAKKPRFNKDNVDFGYDADFAGLRMSIKKLYKRDAS
jgi:hypothetical protein